MLTNLSFRLSKKESIGKLCGLIRKLTITILVFYIFSTSAESQFYNTGSDPWSTRWQQLRTDSVRLIYNARTSEQMKWLTPYMRWLAANGGKSLGHSPRHIDFIFHCSAALSNGVVTWAPKRAEIYPYVSGDDDSELWIKHVVLHEYRHAVQIDALNQGFTHGLYYLFGEQVIGGLSGVLVPRWFLEGDAVLSETLFGRGGRGRKAAFTQEMRAAVLAQKTPSYEQAFFGSYKWQLPDFYRMGYLITAAARLKYGSQIWADALSRTARKPWSIMPFNISLRQTTGGKGKLHLYKESMNYWRSLWQKQDSSIQATPFDIVSQRNTDYESYIQPKQNERGVVAFKTSPNYINQFVLIDKTGCERTLATPSEKNDFDFALHGDTLLWSERRPHIRWENAHHNVLIMYDIASRRKRVIAKGRRISQPDISPSGEKIVAIEFNSDNTQSIVILDFCGAKIAEYKLKVDELVAWPRWIDNQTIAAVFNTDEGKRIETIDIASYARKTLLAATHENIRHLSATADTLYYTNDKTGLDNIYALSTKGGQPQRLTSSQYGAAWATKQGNTLIYSNLSPNGYDVTRASSKTLPTDTPFDAMRFVVDSLAPTEKQFAAEAVNSLDTSNYSRANLLKFHSWGPAIVDANAYTVKPGLSVASQNLLNTCVFQASVDFDKDKTEVANASISYNGFYPRLSVTGTYGYTDIYFSDITEEEETWRYKAYRSIKIDSRQHQYRLRSEATLPLNFSSGAWHRLLQPQVAVELQKNSGYSFSTQRMEQFRTGTMVYEPEKGKTAGETYSSINYNVTYQHVRRAAARDIGPRWGMILTARYRHTPWGVDVGKVASAEATIFLPGLLPHQRIALIYKTQQKKHTNPNTTLYLSDDIDRARGYKAILNDKQTLWRANYDTPLWNADLTLGPVVHLKRLSMQAFYDHCVGTTVPISNTVYSFRQRSTGVTLTAETFWIRLPFSINLGCRTAYLIETKKIDASFVMGISLN